MKLPILFKLLIVYIAVVASLLAGVTVPNQISGCENREIYAEQINRNSEAVDRIIGQEIATREKLIASDGLSEQTAAAFHEDIANLEKQAKLLRQVDPAECVLF